MSAQLRAELFRQRSTRTLPGLLAAMLGLVLLSGLLHGLGLPSEDLARRGDQLMVFGRGELLGALFAALAGAMSITGEFRHGTIRLTFLVTPRRGRVLVAKLSASVIVGATFGLTASAVSAGVVSAILGVRGVEIGLDAGDYAVLIAGSAAAGALLAPIGAGLGAVVRDQVPVTVGIAAWLLFVEGLFIGDTNAIGDIGRYLPGALGEAVSGQVPALAPGIALPLLAVYAAVAAAVGYAFIAGRDVA